MANHQGKNVVSLCFFGMTWYNHTSHSVYPKRINVTRTVEGKKSHPRAHPPHLQYLPNENMSNRVNYWIYTCLYNSIHSYCVSMSGCEKLWIFHVRSWAFSEGFLFLLKVRQSRCVEQHEQMKEEMLEYVIKIYYDIWIYLMHYTVWLYSILLYIMYIHVHIHIIIYVCVCACKKQK